MHSGLDATFSVCINPFELLSLQLPSFFHTSSWYYFILSLQSSAAFAIYRHFSRAESQFFLGYRVTYSTDYPTIHPSSAPESRQKRKITCVLSPQKVHSSPLKIDATHTSNSRKKYCRFTSLSSAPSCFLAVLVVPHRHTTSLPLSPGLII